MLYTKLAHFYERKAYKPSHFERKSAEMTCGLFIGFNYNNKTN